MQGMSEWWSNDRKMTSHRNFKVRFSERPFDLVRGFLFEFAVI